MKYTVIAVFDLQDDDIMSEYPEEVDHIEADTPEQALDKYEAKLRKKSPYPIDTLLSLTAEVTRQFNRYSVYVSWGTLSGNVKDTTKEVTASSKEAAREAVKASLRRVQKVWSTTVTLLK